MTFHTPHQPLLSGGCNLRDLGGHETISGDRVRKGVIFRSGVLSYLTPSDYCCLARAQIQTIVDLRRPDEIEAEPTNWPGPVKMVNLPPDEAVMATQRSGAWMRAKDAEGAQAIMRDTYGTMHEWLSAPLRAIFQSVVDLELALLFHCSAGKDRTGFCAAMVLGLVGVGTDTILRDYAFTDEAVDLEAFAATHRNSRLGISDNAHEVSEIPADVRAVLMKADPSYLRVAIEAVNERYGSIEGYVRDRLGLSAEQIDAVRYQLLDD